MKLVRPISQTRLDLKLAKKNEETTPQPKVSKLPLPIADSPLVIDLPDGQKIVVGKMTAGSVIEVATWRGVGRPDSRTSRLMLGVGAGNVNEEESKPENATKNPEKRAEGINRLLWNVNQFLKRVPNLQLKAVFPRKKNIQKSENDAGQRSNSFLNSAAPAPDKIDSSKSKDLREMSSSSKMDSDVEEWLNQISQKASASASKSTRKSSPAMKSTAKKRKAAPKSPKSASKKR